MSRCCGSTISGGGGGGGGGSSNIVFGLRLTTADIAVGDFVYFLPIPTGGTWALVKAEGWTDTGTVTFNFEDRADPLTPDAEILAADLVADDTGEATAAFNETNLTPSQYVVLVIAAFSGVPTVFQATLTIAAS